LIRIEHGDAAVAGVGDEHLIGRGIVGDRGGAIQCGLAIGALDLSRCSDLPQELSVARELEHVSVAGDGRRGCRTCTASCCLAAGGRRIVGATTPTGRRRVEARRRDPHVAFAIDGEAARRLWPRVALARSTPVRDEHALLIELEDEWCGLTAQAGRWGIEHHPLLVGLERVGAAMDDPEMVLGVDGDAGHGSENPRLVRERARPPRIDLIAGSTATSLRRHVVLKGGHAEKNEQRAIDDSTRQGHRRSS
jgi:hypothetical protein